MRVPCLVATLACTCIWFGSVAHAQETTLRVGFRGADPNNPLDTFNISTATVDSYLNTFLPSQFTAHYTRDKANAVFAHLESMRVQLTTDLVGIVNTISRVSVHSITVQTNSLEASLAQTATGIRLAVTGLSIDASIRYDVNIPVLCDSADGSFTIGGISVGGDYDLPTGALVNPRVDFSLQNVHAHCNGLLSGLVNTLVDAFRPGYARDRINGALQSGLNGQLGAFDMRQIFSVHDFLEGLRNASNLGILNAAANRVIDAGEQIIDNPSTLNRGVKLTVGVSYGSAGNEVRFVVSNAVPTDVVAIQYTYTNIVDVCVSSPGTTSYVDLFEREPGNPYWFSMGTWPASQPCIELSGPFSVGTTFAAVGRNAWISEAHAEFGNTEVTTFNPVGCTDDCGPISTD